MEKFTSILDQFKQAENNDERFSAGMAGMTSILSGGSNILGKMKDLSAVKDSMQYDLQLNNMQDAGRQNFYTTDSFMQDALSRPSGFNVERNSLAQSGRNIASGMLGSTLQGASTGFELGGIWGGIAGAVAGLGASGLAAFKGRRDAHKAEDDLRQREQEERRLMDNRYVMQADNVNNYMMNQAYAHRVAEGGKVQTTISMGDFAKKVLAKRPYAAGGQVNNPLGAFSTHGGFFSPGIIRVNEGGSHEENPYGGVQYGTDQQGVPNLVEQGENIWKDYVFSDRLKPSKKMLKEFNLPEKYYGMTFARISDKLSEEADSRPNDAVSKRGMDAMLARLEACQEQLKAEKAEREQAAMTMQEAPLPEELMMAQQPTMPQQMPQDAMMEQGMPMMEGAPMMAAYGGRVNTFGPGGWLNGLLSRYKENHVPQNFQAYENDPYMYGEIDPAMVIEERERPGKMSDSSGVIDWISPEAAFMLPMKMSKAARAARGSQVMKDSRAFLKSSSSKLKEYEKELIEIENAQKAKEAKKIAAKEARDRAAREGQIASDIEKARTEAVSVAQKAYDDAKYAMDVVQADFSLAKEAFEKSKTRENYEAMQKLLQELDAKSKAAEGALGSLNEANSALKNVGDEQAKAIKEFRNPPKQKKVMEPKAKKSEASATDATVETANPSRRKKLLKWGAITAAGLGTGSAIEKVATEMIKRGKQSDTESSLDPVPAYGLAYGGNLFDDGGRKYKGVKPYVVDMGNFLDDKFGRDLEYYYDNNGNIVVNNDYSYGRENRDLETKAFENSKDFVGPVLGMYSSKVGTGLGAATGTGAGSGKKPKTQIPVAPVRSDNEISDMLLSRNRISSVMDGALPRVDTKFLEGSPTFASLAKGYEDKRNKDFGDMVRKQAATLGQSSSPMNSDIDALPTWMRYSGALQSGLAAIDSALRHPDYSLADSYKSMMRSAPHRQVAYRPQFVAPRYNPDDVNMMANQAAAMSMAGMRQMANNGAGPSMMAVAPMMGYLSSQALGSAMAQGRLDNYQKYLQHVNTLNQINGQIAAGDMQAQSQNANLREYANQFNAGMLDRYNQFRDAEDTARAAAISQNSSLTANNLANIGRENFSMNQIRSNPAFLGYGIGINGMLDYAKPAACGGKRKTKKK